MELNSSNEYQGLFEQLRKIEIAAEAGATPAELLPLLHELHDSNEFKFELPDVLPGNMIYRARRVKSRPNTISEISYPPADAVKVNGRLNCQGEVLFYGSVGGLAACLYECSAQVGDLFALSRWELLAAVQINHMGFSHELARSLSPIRQLPDYLAQSVNPKNDIIRAWQSKIFTRRVLKGNEHQYNLSIALAKFAFKPHVEPLLGGKTFAGIYYPAVSINSTGDNVVLLPSVVDQVVALREVLFAKVNSVVDNIDLKDPKDMLVNVDFIDRSIDHSSAGWLVWGADKSSLVEDLKKLGHYTAAVNPTLDSTKI